MSPKRLGDKHEWRDQIEREINAPRFNQVSGSSNYCHQYEKSGSSDVCPSKERVFTADPGNSGYNDRFRALVRRNREV
jgi:hypothetical protein